MTVLKKAKLGMDSWFRGHDEKEQLSRTFLISSRTSFQIFSNRFLEVTARDRRMLIKSRLYAKVVSKNLESGIFDGAAVRIFDEISDKGRESDGHGGGWAGGTGAVSHRTSHCVSDAVHGTVELHSCCDALIL